MKALGFLVVCACGSAPTRPEPVSNRAGAAAQNPCEVPHSLILDARRRANVDRDDPEWSKTTPWRIEIVRDGERDAHVVMRGDTYDWTFKARGKLSCERIALYFDSHEPFELTLDHPLELAQRHGQIRSIDDIWEIP